MKILYSPQRNDEVISYEFSSDKITVNYNNEMDVFDFTGFENGIMETTETILPINPIISAKKENGILSVELLYYIGPNPTEEERFPKWTEV